MKRARRLRRDATPAELRLWSALRKGALDGAKLRRQQRLGSFYGDFVCLAKRLVVEVDGDGHHTDDGIARHERRTACRANEGFRVIRFDNLEVMKNVGGVAETIPRALTLPPPAAAGPFLSPDGERAS